MAKIPAKMVGGKKVLTAEQKRAKQIAADKKAAAAADKAARATERETKRAEVAERVAKAPTRAKAPNKREQKKNDRNAQAARRTEARRRYTEIFSNMVSDPSRSDLRPAAMGREGVDEGRNSYQGYELNDTNFPDRISRDNTHEFDFAHSVHQELRSRIATVRIENAPGQDEGELPPGELNVRNNVAESTDAVTHHLGLAEDALVSAEAYDKTGDAVSATHYFTKAMDHTADALSRARHTGDRKTAGGRKGALGASRPKLLNDENMETGTSLDHRLILDRLGGAVKAYFKKAKAHDPENRDLNEPKTGLYDWQVKSPSYVPPRGDVKIAEDTAGREARKAAIEAANSADKAKKAEAFASLAEGVRDDREPTDWDEYDKNFKLRTARDQIRDHYNKNYARTQGSFDKSPAFNDPYTYAKANKIDLDKGVPHAQFARDLGLPETDLTWGGNKAGERIPEKAAEDGTTVTTMSEGKPVITEHFDRPARVNAFYGGATAHLPTAEDTFTTTDADSEDEFEKPVRGLPKVGDAEAAKEMTDKIDVRKVRTPELTEQEAWGGEPEEAEAPKAAPAPERAPVVKTPRPTRNERRLSDYQKTVAVAAKNHWLGQNPAPMEPDKDSPDHAIWLGMAAMHYKRFTTSLAGTNPEEYVARNNVPVDAQKPEAPAQLVTGKNAETGKWRAKAGTAPIVSIHRTRAAAAIASGKPIPADSAAILGNDYIEDQVKPLAQRPERLAAIQEQTRAARTTSASGLSSTFHMSREAHGGN